LEDSGLTAVAVDSAQQAKHATREDVSVCMVNYQMGTAPFARILVVHSQSAMSQDSMPNANANMEGIGLIARMTSRKVLSLTVLHSVDKDQPVERMHQIGLYAQNVGQVEGY